MTGRTTGAAWRDPKTGRCLGLGLAAALLVGCGSENAILEVELQVPAAFGGRTFAVVDVQRGNEDLPTGASGPTRVAPLGAEESPFLIEVVAEEARIGDPFHLRVRYCVDNGCTTPGDGEPPSVEFAFERSHYAGHRTRWSTPLPSVEDLLMAGGRLELMVDRCDIEGCRDGDAITWCRRDGTHFCE